MDIKEAIISRIYRIHKANKLTQFAEYAACNKLESVHAEKPGNLGGKTPELYGFTNRCKRSTKSLRIAIAHDVRQISVGVHSTWANICTSYSSCVKPTTAHAPHSSGEVQARSAQTVAR
jgi:hypothetical protein